MCKYSFIIPYYKRRCQFANTLQGFSDLYSQDVEIIVVEDYKNKNDAIEHQSLLELVNQYNLLNIKVVTGPINHIDPAPLFNMGAFSASGDYLLLTSPECQHKGDLLSVADKMFLENPEQYLVFACVTDDGYYYQHSIYNNNRYNFCSIVPRHLYYKIGGFDDRFGLGVCYDDNDFITNIIFHRIPVATIDDPYVLHQRHEIIQSATWAADCERNRNLYVNKWELIRDHVIASQWYIEQEQDLIIKQVADYLDLTDVYIFQHSMLYRRVRAQCYEWMPHLFGIKTAIFVTHHDADFAYLLESYAVDIVILDPSQDIHDLLVSRDYNSIVNGMGSYKVWIYSLTA